MITSMKRDIRWREVAFVFLGSQFLASPIVVGGLLSRTDDMWISPNTVAGAIAAIAVTAWFGLVPQRRMAATRTWSAKAASAHDDMTRIRGACTDLNAAIARRDPRAIATEFYFLQHDLAVAELSRMLEDSRGGWRLRRAVRSLLRTIDEVSHTVRCAEMEIDPLQWDWPRIQAAGQRLDRASGLALRLACPAETAVGRARIAAPAKMTTVGHERLG